MGHIYFTDDGDVAAGGVQQQQPSTSQPAAAAAPSVPQGTSTRFAACCSRARVSYNDADPTYVFKACRSPDNATVATSLSNNSIKVYNCTPAGLGHAGDIPAAHQATISDIQFALPDVAHALYSCSRDGHVKAWDLRSRQQAER
jgi:WD40 repeat protein